MTVIVLEVAVATIITRIGGSAISNAQPVVLTVYQSSADGNVVIVVLMVMMTSLLLVAMPHAIRW